MSCVEWGLICNPRPCSKLGLIKTLLDHMVSGASGVSMLLTNQSLLLHSVVCCSKSVTGLAPQAVVNNDELKIKLN